MTCGNPHPTQALTCQRGSINHEFHSAYDPNIDGFVDWPNPDYTPSASNSKQREGRTRKKLKDMAQRATTAKATTKPTFYPTERDVRGRVALYLMKYEGEWIGLDELEMKTVGGSAAFRCIQELSHHFGWNIAQKMGDAGKVTHFKFTS